MFEKTAVIWGSGRFPRRRFATHDERALWEFTHRQHTVAKSCSEIHSTIYGASERGISWLLISRGRSFQHETNKSEKSLDLRVIEWRREQGSNGIQFTHAPINPMRLRKKISPVLTLDLLNKTSRELPSLYRPDSKDFNRKISTRGIAKEIR